MGASDTGLPPLPPEGASDLIRQGYWFGVCLWLDLLDTGEVINWAWELLETGHDHDSIGVLAGELRPQRNGIVAERLLPVLDALCIARPDSREDALWLYLRRRVSELEQAETAQDRCDLLSRLGALYRDWDDEETGLQDFYYLYEAVDTYLRQGAQIGREAVDCSIWEQEATNLSRDWLQFQSAPPLQPRWSLLEKERPQGPQWPGFLGRWIDWIKGR